MFVADLSAQSQVRRLPGEVLLSLSRIDVLVNNVGGYWNTRHVTADGLERTFALNHLAPFLLTNLLLDRLKHSAPARVVTVSSNVQAIRRIDFEDLQGERSYSGARAYNQSKLANVLFTYELARRLQGTAVTANALHPGVVRTSFGAEDPGGVQRLFTPFVRPFMKAPGRGAATSIHLASAPDLEQVTGRCFASSQPRRSSRRSYDQAAAARLWPAWPRPGSRPARGQREGRLDAIDREFTLQRPLRDQLAGCAWRLKWHGRPLRDDLAHHRLGTGQVQAAVEMNASRREGR